MRQEIWNWISQSYEIIEKGITNKLESPDGKIKIYKCGTIIRVDIKEDKQ